MMLNGLAGLGQAEPFSLTQTMRDAAETIEAVKPIALFIGDHPVLATTILILTIIAGGAVGGYIGVGIAEERGS